MLPVEVEEIAKNVSVEKRNEVQTVLNKVFDGVSKMRKQLDTVNVIDPNDKVNMKLANTIRLGVRNVRLDAEKTFDKKRQEVQLQMLSYKTEDQLWLKAKQTMQILTKEIEEQARWKEETKQRYDAEQKELKVQQRIVQVSKFAPEMSRSEFEHMSDDGFSLFLSGIEKKYFDRIEAERKLEEERIAKEKAEAEERQRIRQENERLKREAEEKEKAFEIERQKVVAERKAAEEKAKKEREEAERILLEERKAAQEKLRIEQENARKLALEIEAKNKAEQDAKEKAEREAKQKEEQKKAQIEAELKKVDSDKVKDLISDLNLLKSKYEFKSQKNIKMYSDVGILLDKIVIHINQS